MGQFLTSSQRKEFVYGVGNTGYNRPYQVQDLAKELDIKILYLLPFTKFKSKFMKRKLMTNRYFLDVEIFQRELMLFLRRTRKA